MTDLEVFPCPEPFDLESIDLIILPSPSLLVVIANHGSETLARLSERTIRALLHLLVDCVSSSSTIIQTLQLRSTGHLMAIYALCYFSTFTQAELSSSASFQA